MAIAVELQAERCPGRHAQIDQVKFGVLELEVVVQALSAVRPHERLMRLLVAPGLVGSAGFHGRGVAPGPDGRRARATTSSQRMCGSAMCWMVTPAQAASEAARSCT